MKIKLLLFSFLISISYSLAAFPVRLYQKPGVEGSPLTPIKKRMPQASIIAEQDSQLFLFSGFFVGTIISLYLNDGEIFSATIGENGIVELPDGLCGEYELRVYVGDAVYSANINL